ncbi:hypothetical protein ACHAW5_007849 [Stephanodiscus triporus]|uniref:Uncharacterized protein n=1 Tax=Stephanodiscus triporus TaxID=2934178 RepID=A0ABD3Q8S7_9STRA
MTLGAGRYTTYLRYQFGEKKGGGEDNAKEGHNNGLDYCRVKGYDDASSSYLLSLYLSDYHLVRHDLQFLEVTRTLADQLARVGTCGFDVAVNFTMANAYEHGMMHDGDWQHVMWCKVLDKLEEFYLLKRHHYCLLVGLMASVISIWAMTTATDVSRWHQHATTMADLKLASHCVPWEWNHPWE